MNIMQANKENCLQEEFSYYNLISIYSFHNLDIHKLLNDHTKAIKLFHKSIVTCRHKT